MRPITYGRQDISEEDIEAVLSVLKSDFLTQGPNIAAFESSFAQYIGSNYAVAVANGTAALHLAAIALNVKPGSKVITTPISFAASANCILYCGGEIVFVDINPDNIVIDIDQVSNLLSQKPKGTYDGIIPVDFAGYPVNIEALKALADEYDLWILEDACHAPGGYFTDSKGLIQKCGNCSYSDISVFSFHPVKHITTGEGGMITTNRRDIYERLLRLRTHGITKNPSEMGQYHGGWYMEMQELGYNYRMTDFQAALGSSQLKKAETGVLRRQEIKTRYDEAFKNIKLIKTIDVPKDIRHASHLYIIQIADRKGLYDYLKENNIYPQVHYIPLHLMPYYRSLGHKLGDCPNAEKYYENCLSLPMYPSLTLKEQQYVIDKIKHFLIL